MARKKIANDQEDDEPGLDISSLIDVCFLLLIYFLVTTTIQPREQDLKMALPAAAPSQEPMELQPMLINIAKSGQIFLNAGSAAELIESSSDNRILSNLGQRVDSYSGAAKAGGKEPVVQILADGEAEQQRIIDVLNCLAQYRISRVTFTDLVDPE